jgi:S1-C subfamily serine protease
LACEIVANAENNPRFASLINRAAMTCHNASHWTRLRASLITAVNGTPIKDSRELARTIAGLAPDSSIKLDILRQGETKTMTATIAEMPKEHETRTGTMKGAPSPGTPSLGLSVEPATNVEGAGDKGVVVTAVDPDGPAAQQGIRPGYIILDRPTRKPRASMTC